MSSIIEDIKPETVEMIKAEAKARGQSVDEYLRDLLPPINGNIGEPLYRTARTLDWIQAFFQWAESHRILPSIADDSRETIYQGRGNEDSPR